MLRFIGLLSLFIVSTAALLTADLDDPADVILKVKHRLGSIKADATSGKAAVAAEKIEAVEDLLRRWRINLLESNADDSDSGGDSAGTEADAPARESTAEFAIKVNHVPKSCKRKSKPGDTLKIHYIGKILPEKKMFDSSFHTGSMPVKVVLGGKGAPIDGWHKGLEGMCRGERRDLTIPAALGYGAAGDAKHKVPPNADLLYHMELVDLSKGKGGEL